MKSIVLLGLLALSSPALASAPAAWAQLDRDVARACIGKAGLARARLLGDRLSFSDAIPVELRIVQGFDRGGRYARRVCAFDRRTRAVEVQEVTPRLGGATGR